MLEVVRRWFEVGGEREDALCCFDDHEIPPCGDTGGNEILIYLSKSASCCILSIY